MRSMGFWVWAIIFILVGYYVLPRVFGARTSSRSSG